MQVQAGLKDWPAKQQHYIQHLLSGLLKYKIASTAETKESVP